MPSRTGSEPARSSATASPVGAGAAAAARTSRMENEFMGLGSPDAPLLPWDCVGLGQRHSENLDISELRRMLEEQ